MGNTFGVSGLRGEANISLTADVVYGFGRFLGWYIRKGLNHNPRTVIGKDTRRSSDMLESAISAGLMASGCDVYLMSVTTTPSVSFITRSDSFDCGVMITASHNPYYDNGIKVISASGEPMGDKIFSEFQAYYEGARMGEIPYADRDSIGKCVDYQAGRQHYIDHLVSVPSASLKGIRIGLDCANGASSMIAHSVFDNLDCEVIYVNDDPDGFNINKSCGSAHLEVIRSLVLEKGLDAGFSLDGDADRCMAVDAEGNEVTGDHFNLIYATYLKKRGRLANNLVVGTVVSNLGLRNALEKEGIDYMTTGVGEPLVRKCMVEHGSIIGGEQCGHMVFSEHSTTGDGIVTTLKMLSVMAEEGKSLEDLASPLHMLPQLTINVRVSDKKKASSDPDVLAIVGKITDKLGTSGRVLMRHSDTESLIRVMVEAEDENTCRDYAQQIVSVIRSKGYAV
ncbi:MAG: phosphoglucosamine mutase [Spirochaetales bacterium]|nr:phosphoglucosamine mutase [Spirochaetales bacterium]